MMRSRILLVLALVQNVSFAETDAEYAERATAVPYKIPRVAQLSVTKPSATDDEDGSQEDCSSFVITEKAARFFLSHARSIPGTSRFHDYPVSFCHAEGEVKFKNGDEATWTIVRGGTGLMTLKAGPLKDKVISLYCRRCEDWNL